LPNTTDIQLQDTVGVFTEDLTNLSEDTTHEFQAFGSVRDVSDDGVVLTFETGPDILDSGLLHRFDAREVDEIDGNDITNWEDVESGSNLSGGSPTYIEDGIEGHPAIDFDDDFMDSSMGSISQPLTLVWVFEPRDYGFLGGLGNSSFDDDRQSVATNSNSEAWRIRTESGDERVGSVTPDDLDEPYITITVFDGSDGIHRANGEEFDVDLPTKTSDHIGVGNSSEGSSNFFTGSIGEFLIYDEKKDESEREEIENSLSDKWGITL